MGLNRDKLQEKEETGGYVRREYPEESWFPERDTDTNLYVLRTKEDDEDYRVPLFVHPNPNKDEHAILCLAKHEDAPCYFCEKAKELFASTLPQDEKIARKLYHKKRSLINIVIKGEEKVRVFCADQRIDKHGIYLVVIKQDNPDITDANEGTYITISRKSDSGGGWDTFSVSISRKDVPLLNWKKRMDERYNLEEFFSKFSIRYSYQEQKDCLENNHTQVKKQIEATKDVPKEVAQEETATTSSPVEPPPCYGLGKKNNSHQMCINCEVFKSCDLSTEENIESEVLDEIANLGK